MQMVTKKIWIGVTRLLLISLGSESRNAKPRITRAAKNVPMPVTHPATMIVGIAPSKENASNKTRGIITVWRSW